MRPNSHGRHQACNTTPERLRFLLGTLSVAACGSNEVGGTTTASSAVVGAWYGSGAEFPDDALCLVFCANGRLFTSSVPCTDTSTPDFDTYLEYTLSNGKLEARSSAGTIITGTVDLQGDAATFTLVESGTTLVLPMTRTAADSPVCARTDVTLRTGL
jgi:hypothetical protein